MTDTQKALEALSRMYGYADDVFDDAAVREDFETIRAALEAKAVDVGWKLIETAPRDGTDVLITDGKDYAVAYFNGEQWRDVGDIGWAGIDIDYPDEDQPTHWMPLPKPPTKETL